MAPVAFKAFILACVQTKIHPFRIGQTLSDHPRSVGYHLSDGTLKINGKREKYTTALDLGAWDLSRAKLNEFTENLAKGGFAAFYREGPKWKGGEHIHAIFAGLPMKSQLRGQIRQWESKRRLERKKSYAWQRKWRRFWR